MPAVSSGDDELLDLVENAPCGLLVASMAGAILRVNETFLAWTGYTRDELVGGKKFVDLLTVGSRLYHETHYAPLLRMQGSAREIAIEIVTADGRRLPALVNATVKANLEGDAEAVRIAVFAASDRRGYEQELVRARRRAEESEARARVLAETLQASLIPPTPPQIPRLDIGAAFRPAGSGAEVGGDFYDVFEIAQRDWAVTIGDVCGKGAGAAAVTALARYTMRAGAISERDPRLVLALLNDAMLRQRVDTFCTALCVRVTRNDDDQTEVTIASGGHPLPIHINGDGDVRRVGEPGTLIGVLPDPDLHDRTVTLLPGEVMAFFTDGVSEGRRGDEFFGEERLARALVESRGTDAVAIADEVVRRVLEFQEDEPRDDIAVVVLKVPMP